MVVKYYLLPYNPEVISVLGDILKDFSCYVNTKKHGNMQLFIELTINPYDINKIEDRLRPYM